MTTKAWKTMEVPIFRPTKHSLSTAHRLPPKKALEYRQNTPGIDIVCVYDKTGLHAHLPRYMMAMWGRRIMGYRGPCFVPSTFPIAQFELDGIPEDIDRKYGATIHWKTPCGNGCLYVCDVLGNVVDSMGQNSRRGVLVASLAAQFIDVVTNTPAAGH